MFNKHKEECHCIFIAAKHPNSQIIEIIIITEKNDLEHEWKFMDFKS